MTTAKERAALDELEAVDRSNRVGRTAIQAGTSAAVVTVVEYGAAYPGWDLDPWDSGIQAHFPPVFTGALFTLIAALLAWWMNRPGKAPNEDGQSVLVVALVAAAVCLALLLLLDLITIR